MLTKYAWIRDGVVFNLSVGDTTKPIAVAKDVLRLDVGGVDVAIGDLYDGKTFTKPPEPEPIPIEKTLEQRLADLEGKVSTLEKAKSG